MASAQLERSTRRILTAATANGTSEVFSGVVDTAGCESVVFSCILDVAASNNIRVQGGEAANLSDAADLVNTRVAPAANGDLVMVEVVRPLQRYLRLAVVRGSSTPISAIIGEVVNNFEQPVSNNATGVRSEIHQQPAYGTA